MTTLWVILTFTVLAAVGLGLILRNLRRGPDAAGTDLATLLRQPTAERAFGPVIRLFSKDDQAFLASQSGYRHGMARQFRLQRHRILSVYLKEIYREFSGLWLFCRKIAPQTQDPNFAATLVQQLFVFHALYFALRMRCMVGAFVYLHVDTEELLAALESLRSGAREVAGALQPRTAIATAA